MTYYSPPFEMFPVRSANKKSAMVVFGLFYSSMGIFREKGSSMLRKRSFDFLALI